jgi:hypothetical protein
MAPEQRDKVFRPFFTTVGDVVATARHADLDLEGFEEKLAR